MGDTLKVMEVQQDGKWEWITGSPLRLRPVTGPLGHWAERRAEGTCRGPWSTERQRGSDRMRLGWLAGWAGLSFLNP